MFKKLKAGLSNALIWGAAWFGGPALILGAFVLLGLSRHSADSSELQRGSGSLDLWPGLVSRIS